MTDLAAKPAPIPTASASPTCRRHLSYAIAPADEYLQPTKAFRFDTPGVEGLVLMKLEHKEGDVLPISLELKFASKNPGARISTLLDITEPFPGDNFRFPHASKFAFEVNKTAIMEEVKQEAFHPFGRIGDLAAFFIDNCMTASAADAPKERKIDAAWASAFTRVRGFYVDCAVPNSPFIPLAPFSASLQVVALSAAQVLCNPGLGPVQPLSGFKALLDFQGIPALANNPDYPIADHIALVLYQVLMVQRHFPGAIMLRGLELVAKVVAKIPVDIHDPWNPAVLLSTVQELFGAKLFVCPEKA